MRAVVVNRTGGPEVLEPTELDEPSPGRGQALVAVAAIGVNYIDTYHRRGLYPVPPPFVPGQEGAGEVVAVGDGVTEVRPGDRVAWLSILGSYAERVVAPVEALVPVPDGVPLETAAAVLVQGVTAQYLCADTYPVRDGDAVLLHAAAGGVGLLLTQLVARRGGRVIGTVSTVEKERLAREAGAAEVIRYTEADFVAETRKLTGGEGVHVVYDAVGRDTFDGSLDCLRRRGMLVLYGQSSGPVPPFDPQRLQAAGSAYLTRPAVAAYTATREELLRRTGAVFDLVADRTLSVRIGGRYPLADARAAHEDLQGRRTTGKLLLLVSMVSDSLTASDASK